jgi:hypothetical protein
MKDTNGVTVTVGDRAMVMSGCNKGSIGTVRAVGMSPIRKREHARVAEGVEGRPTWSSWVESGDVAVVPPVEEMPNY